MNQTHSDTSMNMIHVSCVVCRLSSYHNLIITSSYELGCETRTHLPHNMRCEHLAGDLRTRPELRNCSISPETPRNTQQIFRRANERRQIDDDIECGRKEGRIEKCKKKYIYSTTKHKVELLGASVSLFVSMILF